MADLSFERRKGAVTGEETNSSREGEELRLDTLQKNLLVAAREGGLADTLEEQRISRKEYLLGLTVEADASGSVARGVDNNEV